MTSDLYQLVLGNVDDLPSANSPDHVLSAWLAIRLGRPPAYLEVLEFRSLLKQIERRQTKRGWAAWWQRLRPIRRPSREDLVKDFLESEEGQFLLHLVGGMAALMTQLALPDPWLGYDGRHPTMPRQSRRERMRERAAAGLALPGRFQAMGVRAYAQWKLTRLPENQHVAMPEDAGFVSETQVAAINAMSPEAIHDVITRLDLAHRSGTGYRALLHELDRAGIEAKKRWPGIERRNPGPPLGIWPEEDSQFVEKSDVPDEQAEVQLNPASLKRI